MKKSNDEELMERWKDVPAGTSVDVPVPDGSKLRTKTASRAWLLGGQRAVIKLEGLPGVYALKGVQIVYP